MGRCNSRAKSQVQGFHRLRTSATPNAKNKASCLGKSELQPKGVARSNVLPDQVIRGVLHRPVEPTGLIETWLSNHRRFRLAELSSNEASFHLEKKGVQLSEAFMEIPEWKEIAIPKGLGPCRLLYNPPSGIVIAELSSIGDEFSPNRLYIRKTDSPKYEPIKLSGQMLSSESAVTSLGRPSLFYLSNKFTKRDKGFSGDWEGLYSFDLQQRTHLKIADKDSLRLPPPYVEGWVTGLLDVSADASELYLTIGMMPPKSSDGFQAVTYQLARMDLPTGNIHVISQLKGAFF
jgi:hypothetical protein